MKKKKYIFLFIFIFGTILLFNACYYDKAELLYPASANAVCDTTGVISYAQKVVPILQGQCYGCHTATGGSGGINMSSYANDKVVGLNGKLYGSISHASGYFAMPQGGNMLSSCNIAYIKKWIDGGCLNN